MGGFPRRLIPGALESNGKAPYIAAVVAGAMPPTRQKSLSEVEIDELEARGNASYEKGMGALLRLQDIHRRMDALAGGVCT